MFYLGKDFTVFPSSKAEAQSNIKMKNIYKTHIYHLFKKSDTAMSLIYFFLKWISRVLDT